MSNPTNSPVRGRKQKRQLQDFQLQHYQKSNPTNSPVRGRKPLRYFPAAFLRSFRVQPYQFPVRGRKQKCEHHEEITGFFVSNPTNSPSGDGNFKDITSSPVPIDIIVQPYQFPRQGTETRLFQVRPFLD
ncbi:hypothetical protein [Limnospira platensis]|uniref:hypothetical protein n=1 Tax=Limnospira platensis TaxID=118562 RepID=UPI00028043FF|nr:hypothetical protein SPLC1_S207660 [Arthrospira platensis C1]